MNTQQIYLSLFHDVLKNCLAWVQSCLFEPYFVQASSSQSYRGDQKLIHLLNQPCRLLFSFGSTNVFHLKQARKKVLVKCDTQSGSFYHFSLHPCHQKGIQHCLLFQIRLFSLLIASILPFLEFLPLST